MLSKKALSLKPSPTLAMAATARELAAQGKDVVSLTVGEPDWNTFPCACEAAIQAIKSGHTKYTAVNGIPELRTAIVKQAAGQLGVSYSLKEVTVGAGAKFVIFAALQMLLDPGDEVLIPSPYWVSYPAMVELAGGQSRIIDCGKDVHFKLTPDLLRRAITPRTKMLILCSPSNPTGIMYSKSEIQALAEVIKDFPQLFIISDDIYNRLLFTDDKVAPHLLHFAPELKSRTLAVNGASKTYAMTGWRLGWGLGPEKLIQAMTDYMSQSTSNVSSISQYAVLAAIEQGEADLKVANENMKLKRDWFLDQMKSIKGFQIIEPQGAFYFWTDVTAFLGKKGMVNSKDVAQRLLENFLVATVPGIEFGTEGFLRLSFATSKKNLEKALQRFRAFSESIL